MQPATSQRLDAVRQHLQALSLDGFIVPQADEHQGEYLPASALRLNWLTGFTGSAGTAVVLRERAALFVDGRYTLQAAQEVDTASIEPRHFKKPPLNEWLSRQIGAGARIGYDPHLHGLAEIERLAAALAKRDATLVAVADNPIDVVWADRPAAPCTAIVPQPMEYAGQAHGEKLEAVAGALKAAGAAAFVFNQIDSIAWMLNIRGSDLPYMPAPLAHAIVRDDGTATLYVDQAKTSKVLKAHLGPQVVLAPATALAVDLKALGVAGKAMALEAETATAFTAHLLESHGAQIIRLKDPTAIPRACKNKVERAGIREAHRRDGVAMARFLSWLDKSAPSSTLDEVAVGDKLEDFRAMDPLWRGASFASIVGSGPNGAIVHYRAQAGRCRTIDPGLLLIDSGGQYLCGTTDITRTVAVGAPNNDMRRDFTLVLKGHIGVAMARFPLSATGQQIDALARQFLWRAGLDYDHGTGHGVGSYLGVHEGPYRISPLATSPLAPDALLSNEPGLYRTGQWGIRIENLVLSRLSEINPEFLEFETVTLCPIDRRLIDVTLLSSDEIGWIDGYHARVRDEVAPHLDDETRGWLVAATAPLCVSA